MSDDQDFQICREANEQPHLLQVMKESKSQFSVCLNADQYDKLLQFKKQNQSLLNQIISLQSKQEQLKNRLQLSEEVKKKLQNDILDLNQKLSRQTTQYQQQQKRLIQDKLLLISQAQVRESELQQLKLKVNIIINTNQQLTQSLQSLQEKNKQISDLLKYSQLLNKKSQQAQRLSSKYIQEQKLSIEKLRQSYDNQIQKIQLQNHSLVRQLSNKIQNLALKSSSSSLQINKLKCIIQQKQQQVEQFKDIKQQLNSQLRESKNMIYQFKQSILNYSHQMQAKNLQLIEYQSRLKRLESIFNSNYSQSDRTHSLKYQILQRETIINIMDTELKGLKLKYDKLDTDTTSKLEIMKKQLQNYKSQVIINTSKYHTTSSLKQQEYNSSNKDEYQYHI